MGSIPVRVTTKEKATCLGKSLFSFVNDLCGNRKAGPGTAGVKKCPVDTFSGRGRFPYRAQQHPVGDGSPVPKPDDYGFADTDAKI